MRPNQLRCYACKESCILLNALVCSSNDHITYTQHGPDMNNPRGDHACGIFQSPQHLGRPILVIAGGHSGPHVITNSEYWDFTVPDSKWQQCSKSYVVQFFFFELCNLLHLF